MSSISIRTALALTACVVALGRPFHTATSQSVNVSHQSTTTDTVSWTSPRLFDAAMTPTVLSTRSDSSVAVRRGPLVQPAGVQAMAATRAPSSDEERERDVSVGSNLALVGVGAAAVVVGLLVGGDGGTAIAVGGGVLALVGLYRYLR